ncbi:hypothetical protein [Shewanella sp. HN-41]|uniref:hypothetical protein n=1 Tax=Shewanella sp. HN-41 TaxID=327275 RepID=UPI00021257C4|nr:hypothetical protein [Shewanella sp. HN-41]EGM70568.1 hypothetical protein SOHN41_01324 [Shewanella sp. HN-41]
MFDCVLHLAIAVEQMPVGGLQLTKFHGFNVGKGITAPHAHQSPIEQTSANPQLPLPSV